MQDTEELLDVKAVARKLGLYRRDHTLNTKAVYELKIPKTKVGRRVRYRPVDVELYLLHRVA